MRIHATINERTLRRTFREHLNGNRALTVFDKDLRGFALKVSANRAEPPPLPHETDCGGNGERRPDTPAHGGAKAAPRRPAGRPDRMRPEASPGAKAGRAVMDGLARKGAAPACGADAQTVAQAARRTRCVPI